MIRPICDPAEKEAIAAAILQALPEWFGLPDSTAEYIVQSRSMPFWAAFQGETAVGFAALKETSPDTGEIYVMGVRPDCHRAGVGKALFQALETGARERGYSYLQVKTVRMGAYECYDRTNRFYQAMGFKELECFPALWDPWNPCQVYVKWIGGIGAGAGLP